ncbi:MAG TPA: HD domain-containing phosphohydrolase [Polyangiaceae bacterium]|jgi:response regulator RpfG family c-di-GMP phosphodiesterase
MSSPSKPRVLCVDDEPNILEGLAHTLRRGYEVVGVGSGKAALELLAQDPNIAVIVSDMRMPVMDGAAFLAKARAIAPDATRVLLTGQTELDSAIAAVNEGRIFRFLTKPCAPAVLLASMEGAVQQHRLVTSERVLLEQTLRGSIQMLTEVLALAAPAIFGQAMRIQRHARELATKVPGAQVWPIEVAAMLSQVGLVALPPSAIDKLQEGKPLAASEQQAFDRLPSVAEKFVAGIPRLDEVRAALRLQRTPFDGAGAPPGTPRGKDLPLGARVLAIVCDFDRFDPDGPEAALALDTMRSRRGRYDPELLDLFASALGATTREIQVLEIPARQVRSGMTFLEDVRTQTGMLLVARGHDVTPNLLERFHNFPAGFVREPIRVALTVPPGGPSRDDP